MRVSSRPSAFETAVSAVYRTAFDRSLWQEAIVSVSDYIGASGGLLAFNDLRRREPKSWMITGRLRDDLNKIYLQRYKDNLLVRAVMPLPAGVVYAMSDFVDQTAVVTTSWHADLLLPQRIEDIMVLPYAPWQRGSTVGGPAFMLGPRGAADVDRRQRRFTQMAPHLLRALDLGAALEATEAARNSLFAMVDAIALPAMLLDAMGDLAHANPAAETLLRESDGLQAGGRTAADTKRLKATRPAETQHLAALIGRAVSAAADPAGASEQGNSLSMRIGRPSGRPDLAVCAIPLPAQAAPWSDPAAIRAVLFVLQPGRGGSETDARAAAELGAIYGLTRAEQRVTGLVGAGLGLPETARNLGVSTETARTHLRHSFEKTGARSQVDLARLLAPFPARQPKG